MVFEKLLFKLIDKEIKRNLFPKKYEAEESRYTIITQFQQSVKGLQFSLS